MWFVNCFLLSFLCLFVHEMISVSEGRQEQRTILKFLTKSDATPMDCWRQLHNAFGAETMTPKTVRVWHKKFVNGHLDVKDSKRPGRPCSAHLAKNIGHVQAAVQQDRCATIQDLSSHLGISKTAVHTIVKKDLHLSKLAPKFVPCLLTDEQRRTRKQMCQLNLDSLKKTTSSLRRSSVGMRVG